MGILDGRSRSPLDQPQFVWLDPLETDHALFDSMNCGVNPDVLTEGCTAMESFQAVFDHRTVKASIV